MRRTLRSPLVHFLLVGALLLALQRVALPLFESSEPPSVEVLRSEIDARIEAYQRQMRRRVGPTETLSIENQVIDDALWLEQAWALGLHEVDPVVRQRLLLNMRFLDSSDEIEGESEEALVARAIELGMDRSDMVVRRRLIDRMQAMVRAGVRAEEPGEEILRAHYEATAARWREPELLDLTHVYFSRDKRGEARIADARQILRTLLRSDLPPEEAIGLGDSFLSGHRLQAATPTRIVARLGPDFAEGVRGKDAERWFGPIESAFGTHLVWIHESIESRQPPFAEIRQRVIDDWIDEESRRAMRRHLDRRREVVNVRIVDDRGIAEGDAPAAREG